MIDGMRMDLVKDRYETFDELYEYCYRVAGTVGLMTTPIMGIDPAYKVSSHWDCSDGRQGVRSTSASQALWTSASQGALKTALSPGSSLDGPACGGKEVVLRTLSGACYWAHVRGSRGRGRLADQALAVVPTCTSPAAKQCCSALCICLTALAVGFSMVAVTRLFEQRTWELTLTVESPQGDLEPVYKAALGLGTANQLTNILRDVGEDVNERNRVYIPLNELREFGIPEQAVRNWAAHFAAACRF